jgi:hypothetical protein
MRARALLLVFLIVSLLVLADLQFDFVSTVHATTAFSAVNVTSAHTCPLDTHTFVVAYHDDTNDDFSFQIWDTNGTQVLAETDVDETSGGAMGYTTVGVSALTSTTFVVGWLDKASTNVVFAVYDTSGACVSGPTIAGSDVGTLSYSVQVSCFNSTHFVIAWFNYTAKTVAFTVYNSTGTVISGPTNATTGIGNGYCVSVSAFNSTHFVIGWYDVTARDATFSVYDSSSNLVAGPTDADTNAGLSAVSVSVAALNSTYFVIGWFNLTGSAAAFAVYDSAGALKTGPTVAGGAGPSSMSVQVAVLNSTAFVISWYDNTDYDLSFATYLSDGTAVAAKTDVESWPTAANAPFKYQSPCSQETGTSIKLYSDNWVIAYANTTTQAIWQAFYPNGTAWDGTVPSEGETLSSYGSVTPSFAASSSKALTFQWQSSLYVFIMQGIYSVGSMAFSRFGASHLSLALNSLKTVAMATAGSVVASFSAASGKLFAFLRFGAASISATLSGQRSLLENVGGVVAEAFDVGTLRSWTVLKYALTPLATTLSSVASGLYGAIFTLYSSIPLTFASASSRVLSVIQQGNVAEALAVNTVHTLTFLRGGLASLSASVSSVLHFAQSVGGSVLEAFTVGSSRLVTMLGIGSVSETFAAGASRYLVVLRYGLTPLTTSLSSLAEGLLRTITLYGLIPEAFTTEASRIVEMFTLGSVAQTLGVLGLKAATVLKTSGTAIAFTVEQLISGLPTFLTFFSSILASFNLGSIGSTFMLPYGAGAGDLAMTFFSVAIVAPLVLAIFIVRRKKRLEPANQL